MSDRPGRNAYRMGVALAIAAGAVQVWMNVAVGIVGEDNPQNQGFFGVVVTAIACAFVARAQAAEMARAMLATAAVQALLASMIATAPSTAQAPRGAIGIVILSAVFASLWLASAAMFHRSARMEGLTAG